MAECFGLLHRRVTRPIVIEASMWEPARLLSQLHRTGLSLPAVEVRVPLADEDAPGEWTLPEGLRAGSAACHIQLPWSEEGLRRAGWATIPAHPGLAHALDEAKTLYAATVALAGVMEQYRAVGSLRGQMQPSAWRAANVPMGALPRPTPQVSMAPRVLPHSVQELVVSGVIPGESMTIPGFVHVVANTPPRFSWHEWQRVVRPTRRDGRSGSIDDTYSSGDAGTLSSSRGGPRRRGVPGIVDKPVSRRGIRDMAAAEEAEVARAARSGDPRTRTAGGRIRPWHLLPFQLAPCVTPVVDDPSAQIFHRAVQASACPSLHIASRGRTVAGDTCSRSHEEWAREWGIPTVANREPAMLHTSVAMFADEQRRAAHFAQSVF